MSKRNAVSYKKHIIFGSWGLFAFLLMGAALEVLHAFKVGWYVDVSSSTTRHMFILAHTHGTLFSLVNIVYGLLLKNDVFETLIYPKLTSRGLIAGTILLPLGFFAGGVFVFDGDPGPGIFLVPPAIVLLVTSTFLIAYSKK